MHGRPLRGAAAVQIERVEVADLIGFLKATTGTAADQETKWDPVLTRLTKVSRRDLESNDSVTVGENNLREALSTPLMVSLASTVYSKPGRDPADLLDFRDQASIENHLLDGLITAIYDRAPPDNKSNKSGQRLSPAYSSKDTKRWLRFLAVHLDRLDTRNFEWWSLSRGVPRILGTIVGVPASLLLGLLLVPWFSRDRGRTYGLTYSLMGMITFGIVYSVTYYVAIRTEPSRMSLRFWRGGRVFNWRSFLKGFAYGVSSMLLFGIISGIGIWLASGTGLMSRMFSSVLFGVPLGLSIGLVSGARTPIDVERAINPRELLKNDRLTALWMILLGSFPIALGSTAWGRYSLARIWLATTHRLPWKLLYFLDDAHRRGVFRQVGALYQFRHERLQDRLKETED